MKPSHTNEDQRIADREADDARQETLELRGDELDAYKAWLEERIAPQVMALVKTEFTGWHNWAAAPEDVAYLRGMHRHLFKVTVTVQESFTEGEGIDDREVEYHTLIAAIRHIIDADLPHTGDKIIMPGWSCERIAHVIHSRLAAQYLGPFIEVGVLEDGEAGAVVH